MTEPQVPTLEEAWRSFCESKGIHPEYARNIRREAFFAGAAARLSHAPGGWRPVDAELDRALCNFCNEASDPFEPVSQWDDNVDRALARLCAAYNEWYKATKPPAAAQPATPAESAQMVQQTTDWKTDDLGFRSREKTFAPAKPQGKVCQFCGATERFYELCPETGGLHVLAKPEGEERCHGTKWIGDECGTKGCNDPMCPYPHGHPCAGCSDCKPQGKVCGTCGSKDRSYPCHREQCPLRPPSGRAREPIRAAPSGTPLQAPTSAPAESDADAVERVARAIALADDEDYMEDHARYDKRARAAIAALASPAAARRKVIEECANVADAESEAVGGGEFWIASRIAERIRALAGDAPSAEEAGT